MLHVYVTLFVSPETFSVIEPFCSPLDGLHVGSTVVPDTSKADTVTLNICDNSQPLLSLILFVYVPAAVIVCPFHVNGRSAVHNTLSSVSSADVAFTSKFST